MGRYDDYDWDYYSATQPRKVSGGIKTKSVRGVVGTTWWSSRWRRALEELGMGSRLTRGRSYARQGQVLSIEIAEGQVHARVQGSRREPYRIQIQLKHFSEQQWRQVIDALAKRALYAASLLAGEMPTNIEEVFSALQLSLFPSATADLHTHCTCPDWANPCKHIAAVYYLLAEQFDDDPFLLFSLRGRTRDELLAALRQRRTARTASSNAASPQAETEKTPRLEEHLSDFWQAGEGLESFAVHPSLSSDEQMVIKRLGDAPFTIGTQNLTTFLAQIYDATASAARQRTDAESIDPPSESE